MIRMTFAPKPSWIADLSEGRGKALTVVHTTSRAGAVLGRWAGLVAEHMIFISNILHAIPAIVADGPSFRCRDASAVIWLASELVGAVAPD